MDEGVSVKAIKLLEKYTLSHGLLIIDAIIAATALEHNPTLITSNTKYYQMIEGLKLENHASNSL